MAITTDSYYDVIYNGETVDRIGLSKTLDNYTNEEIASMTFCGTEFALIKNISQREQGVTLLGWDLAKPFDVADGEHIGNGGKYILSPGISPYQYPNGMPFNVVWISFEYGIAPPINLNIHEGNASHCKIITEFDAPKYEYQLTAPMQVGGIGAASWNVDDAPLYTTPLYNHDGHDNTLVYRINDNVTTGSLAPNGGAVVPYMFTLVNDYFVLLLLCPYNNQWYSRGNATGAPWIPDGAVTGGGGYINYDWETSFGASCNVATLAKLSFNGEAISFPYTWYYSENYNGQDWGAPLDCYGYNDLGEPIEVYFNGAPEDGWGSQRAVTLKTFCKNRDQIYKLIAGSGIKFKTDKVYKPIITDGWVTGYTDDMTVPSELDNWHGTTAHSVTPTPPSPTPPAGDDEDNDDPIPTVGAPYSSGLARYYATTAGSTILNHISEAMGAWNLKDTGKDLYKNIISCKLIKPPAPIPISGSEPFTVYGVTLQYEGSDITLPVINDNPTQSFGSYNIPRKFNDFRDYAPYTKVEIYLPYCGWTVLPSHVVGRSVSVTYYTDIIAATCKAVVYCGSNVVAEAAGVIGLDIPMVTENAGAKAEAVSMGLLAYGKAALQTAIGVGAAVATKGKAGVKQAVDGLGNVVSAYSQTAMAFNQNYTEINGKNGDGCCIAGISAIVIKITRPKYGSNTTAPYVPSEYSHSTGFVSMKSAKVGSFTGLLVADNVDTSGISGATDREKQLIKLYLESGIYVNHPN